MSSSDKPVMGVKEGVKRWAVAAAAATVAESSTIPLDVAKTRLQLQNELRGKVGGGKPYRGMIGTLAGVYREEGPRALFRGLPAAVIRQTVYGGIGVGMYQPVRNALVPAGAEPTLAHKVMAGAITGGVGSALATPTDVVKVRLQADGRLAKPRYSGTLDAFLRIPREEGVRGLYRGALPTVQRAMVINGTGTAAYDHCKALLLRYCSLRDATPVHVLSSGLSGLASAIVSVPFDVIKTRLMNQHSHERLYTGAVDCLIKTVRHEGAGALYKGFLPTYSRLAPWQLVFFLCFERLNRLVVGESFAR